MNRQELISRICFFRNRANLSQKELSLRVGMNAGYINRLECKKDFLPSVEVLLQIIEVCETTVEEFFYHDIFSYDADKRLIELISTMDSDKKDALIQLLK